MKQTISDTDRVIEAIEALRDTAPILECDCAAGGHDDVFCHGADLKHLAAEVKELRAVKARYEAMDKGTVSIVFKNEVPIVWLESFGGWALNRKDADIIWPTALEAFEALNGDTEEI